MANLQNLLVLKDKLIKAKEFNEPCNYFLDNFGEDPSFMKVGEKCRSAFLQPVIEEIGAQLLGRKVSVAGMLLTEIPEYQFFHGACFIDGMVANLFYFKDIDMGILSLLRSLKTSEVMLARFSCVYMKPTPTPHSLH
jgi:hypothetical protein